MLTRIAVPRAALYTRTGLRVSPLGLGVMTYGWGADRRAARAIFDLYREHGGNFFDTADMYAGGESETWLGEMVREAGVRDEVVIATKFSFNAQPGNPNAGGNGRKNILRALDGSLRRLQTDFVDLYILHAWDRVTPVEEVMRTLTRGAARAELAALALALPPEIERNLTEVSRPESNELDHFFEPALQGMVHGGTRVRRGIG